jgi:hypothetical protein
MADAAVVAPQVATVIAPTGFASIVFWLATAALTAVLIWGFRMISTELRQPAVPGSGAAGTAPTVLRQALSEKEATPSAPAATPPTGEASFSRVAGAVGAIGIAATFVSIGYWVLHTLFFDIDNLGKIQGLGTYFLAGAAMFLPYAFNQLASIFKT